MWPQMILPPNPIQKKLFTLLKHSKQDSASVAPICKTCERSNPANYMPISLSCLLRKTLEHIVASSIKHLSKLNIFYELQHGLREKSSYDSLPLMLVDDLFKSVYKKRQTHFA